MPDLEGASDDDAMAQLVAANEQLQVAARLAWDHVLDAFARLQSIDEPELQEALAAYKTARALQTATAQRMLQLVKTRRPSHG